MSNNKKGISLISVIITVLVMAILAAVMIPSGVDKINSAKLTSFNDNILILKQEANTYFMQNDEYPAKIDGGGNPVVYSIATNPSLVAEATKKNEQNDIFYMIDLDKIKMDNKDIGVGKTIDDFYIIAKTSGNVYYAKGVKVGSIVYYTKQNKGDGITAIVPSTAPIPNGAYDGYVNAPKLSAGMTAIKWDGSAWVNADTSNPNNEWYDYTQGINRWANVKLKDGSMLVWIPRYTYSIISGEHTSTAGVIDIRFSAGTKNDTEDGYRIHPAFYWGGWNIPASAPMTKQAGGTELTGIWVGKFEPSPANGLQGTSGDKIAVLPNKASWRALTINDIFTKCKNLKLDTATYGDLSTADTHMLKNSEWGAVAYLSKYVLGSVEVEPNPNSSYKTANGDIITNKTESTTGNEYGIYDMSGCAYEYVAAYLDDSIASTYGNSLYIESERKYKDVFPKAATESANNNYEAISQAYGNAMYETSSQQGGSNGWFGQYSHMVNITTSWPWVMRGGGCNSTDIAGLFCFVNFEGSMSNYSFRVSVCVP